MRLIPLREQKTDFELFLAMWNDFLLEQGSETKSKEQLRSTLKEKLLDSTRELFLIEAQNKVVGFSEVFLEEECFPDEDLPEVCLKVPAFYIQPAFREHSFGHQAFKLVRQWGREKEAALLETEVSKKLEESNKFLQEQGLELVGSGQRNIWRGFI